MKCKHCMYFLPISLSFSTDEWCPIGIGIVYMAANIMLTKALAPLSCISNKTKP